MRGRFRSVLTRSVPAPRTIDAVRKRRTTKKLRRFENVEGHLVGFFAGLRAVRQRARLPFPFHRPGLHRRRHLLNCEPEHLDVRLQVFFSMELTLPIPSTT
jgi:alpha-acetolactate decarboxylase